MKILTVDTYASEGLSKKIFVHIAFLVVYAVAMTSHENKGFILQTFYCFFKIDHKIFNSSKLVNFIGRGARILRGDG